MKHSAAEIIDANGGPSAFAAKVNRRPGAVRAWKHRNYFPREAWPEIINAFPDLSLDRLIEIETRLATPRLVAPSQKSPKNDGHTQKRWGRRRD